MNEYSLQFAYETLRDAFEHIRKSDWPQDIKTDARTIITNRILSVAEDKLAETHPVPNRCDHPMPNRNVFEDLEFARRHGE